MEQDHDNYWKLEDSEKHFNNIQAGIRGLASAWLLSAIGAIAFLVQKYSQEAWWIQPELIVLIICAMASLGLLVLWIIDQLVYHRLLNSFFLVGLKYEYDHPDVPPVHATMILSADSRGMSRYLRLYYLIPILTLGAIGLVFFFLLSANYQQFQFLPSALAITPILTSYGIYINSGRIQFDMMAKKFGDREFLTLVKQRNFGQILANYHLQCSQHAGTGVQLKNDTTT